MVEVTIAPPDTSRLESIGVATLRALPVEHLRHPLNVADLGWLEGFDVEEPNAEQLFTVNQTIFMGSLNVSRSRQLAEPADILAARRQFFEGFMGFGDRNSRFFTAYTKLNRKRAGNMLPPLTFIATHRVFDALGVSVGLKLPRISYSPESAREMALSLDDRCLDAAKIAIKAVQTFGHSVEALDECIEDVENEGFPRAIIELFPQIIGFSHDKRIERLRGHVSRHGEAATTMVRRQATILGSQDVRQYRLLEHMQAMLEFLDLPCTAAELVERYPSISNFSKSKIVFLFTIFERFGRELTSKNTIARNMGIAPRDYLIAISKGMTRVTSYKMIDSLVADVPKAERDLYAQRLLDDPLFIEIAGQEIISAYRRWKDADSERSALSAELAAVKLGEC